MENQRKLLFIHDKGKVGLKSNLNEANDNITNELNKEASCTTMETQLNTLIQLFKDLEAKDSKLRGKVIVQEKSFMKMYEKI